MKTLAAVVICFVVIVCRVDCRKVRYHAQFSLQLSNLTYEDIVASPQQLFIVDPDDVKLTADQNAELKAQGKTILAYLSVGEAETFRSYWNEDWAVGSPKFLAKPDAEYQNGVIVEFWQPEWQATLKNYMTTNILPFGYSGILMDYLQMYDQFLDSRPTAPEDMIQFAASLAATARIINPTMLIVTQDAISLYQISEQYRMMIDGVSVEEVFFHDGKVRNSMQTRFKLDRLRQISNDKKVVLLEEYVEKNRHVCEFYKKCTLEGFMCGAFGADLTGVSRDCSMERTAF